MSLKKSFVTTLAVVGLSAAPMQSQAGWFSELFRPSSYETPQQEALESIARKQYSPFVCQKASYRVPNGHVEDGVVCESPSGRRFYQIKHGRGLAPPSEIDTVTQKKIIGRLYPGEDVRFTGHKIEGNALKNLEDIMTKGSPTSFYPPPRIY